MRLKRAFKAVVFLQLNLYVPIIDWTTQKSREVHVMYISLPFPIYFGSPLGPG